METPTCWQDVTDAVSAGERRLLLYGPPGTGKTFFALRSSHDVERIICTSDMTSSELFGMWMPNASSGWTYQEGPAIRAWRGSDGSGAHLVIDEIDHASGDAYSALLALCDSEASAQWRNPSSLEIVRPGANFSVVVTSNATSLSQLPVAIRDRFPVAIYIDQPHPDAVATLSPDLQASASAATCAPFERRISMRAFSAFDRLRVSLGTPRAAELVFGRERARDVLDALEIAALS